MPAYNASKWIAEAIESVLAQTWEEFELVVTDNRSSDSTVAIVRSYADPRIRLGLNPRNLGPIRNANRSVELSTGAFVKFLHADDKLAPECLEEMVGLASEDERIGLVFAPRTILVDDEEDKEWARRFSQVHERFDNLERNNDGLNLFRQLVAAGIEENWIGEPSAVMVRRRCLDQTGLFDTRLRQAADLELWLRIMLRYRVGFVDAPLSVYRHHRESLTAANVQANRHWLDWLWIYELLLREDELGRDERRVIEQLRRVERRRAVMNQLVRIARGQFDGALPAYVRWVLARSVKERGWPLASTAAALARRNLPGRLRL